MKNNKKMLTILTAAALTASMSVPAFAAGWQQNATGWWYGTNADNSEWHKSGWQWLDGNGDGTAECYYFDDNGYMLAGTTTPDGYTVNADGAWVQDGSVQVKSTGENGEGSTGITASASDESGRYTVIGGPNWIIPPNGLQGEIVFDLDHWNDIRNNQTKVVGFTYTNRDGEPDMSKHEEYEANGETYRLGSRNRGGGGVNWGKDTADSEIIKKDAKTYGGGEWVVDNTKPDAVNGKTNIRFRFNDGSFAGYGVQDDVFYYCTDEYSSQLKAARNDEATGVALLSYSGKGYPFFTEDGYMVRNCYVIGLTTGSASSRTKFGAVGGWLDR